MINFYFRIKLLEDYNDLIKCRYLCIRMHFKQTKLYSVFNAFKQNMFNISQPDSHFLKYFYQEI